MTRQLSAVIVASLAIAAPAHAIPTAPHGVHDALRAARIAERAVRYQSASRTAQAACPAGMPAQPFTVVNEVRVPAGYLAKVERAVTAKSMQVRAYWHTPCAAFVASGGWPVYVMWSAAAACDGIWVATGHRGPYGGDVTTGQVVGYQNVSDPGGGPCWVFAAAGTYTVSVQFKASSGSVTASNRKLWVQALSFA